jgi:hypothetical protein
MASARVGTAIYSTNPGDGTGIRATGWKGHMDSTTVEPYVATTPAGITRKLLEPFPAEVIEEKNGLLYIPHEIVRERLINATGNQFDWSIDQVLFRDDGVTRRANDRYSGEPRRPLSMIVLGTLTIPGLGSRTGIGAHPLDEGAGEDAAYKSAESDALKRAAMAFGVGLHQLYIETGNAKRVTRPQRAPVRNQRQDVNHATGEIQDAPKQRPVTDKTFGTQVREAMVNRDADAFRKLIDDADEHVGRWVALVQAAESPQALEWIKRQIERKGVGNDLLTHELTKREAQIVG